MTGRYVLSPRAQLDLDDIWNSTEGRWGIDQAETYIRQIWQHIALIAAHPALGRSCDEVRVGYHKYPAGSHLLFYRITGDGIDVVRILHERMDFAQHLPNA
jgi:toxin ParE1/3/4